ncbi:class I SAM-dependent methyltransferase [Nonomuraea endophytica]|uniref:16S rRNA G966 N2-methylase RsmD n=1 Tax=Nonomuraea endophytica TaxID=714136 RepID=A0A7W8ACI7_9ACTN|nr:class I SAM-dependent methyltransferase [Nonomuraea endophytica]MBB5083595.1 16S rRNA G966 N2-methylase RsmD [Nonomuraea endophytica]
MTLVDRLSGVRRSPVKLGAPLLLGLLATSAPLTVYEGAVVVEEAMMMSGSFLVRLRGWRRWLARMLYDWRFGVSTTDFVDLDDFGLEHPERVYYSPAHWGTLRRALPVRDIDERDVFLDMGSGKGRMVLEAASRYAFKRVIGVELSSDLTDMARDNVDTTTLRLRAHEIELVHSDVLDYSIPDDVSVVFLNNPFRGEIFASVMKQLIASADRRPRPITLIYFNPVEEQYLLGTGRFQHVRTTLPRWRAADGIFGTTRVYSLI